MGPRLLGDGNSGASGAPAKDGTGTWNKLIMAVVMCGLLTSTDAVFCQSGQVGWDGTWVGGWDRGADLQVIFAG